MPFYGGPGESAHKYLVKIPGYNTQRRVSKFAEKIAKRLYESMPFELAHECVLRLDDEFELIGSSFPNDDPTVTGECELRVTGVNHDGNSGDCVIKWKNDNKE